MLDRFINRKALLVLGAFAIVAVVFLIYYPSLFIGFWGDDWAFQERLGRQSALEFIVGRFNPFNQSMDYRPLHGILYLLEYSFFGINAFGYRVVQTGIHIGNCLLLFGLVYQLSRNWRVGLISGLLYAIQDIYSTTLYIITDQVTLATFFYLLTVWVWVLNLQKTRIPYIILTYLFFVMALLSKEAAVTLPVTLFLVDRLLVGNAASLRTLVKRYIPFVIIMLPYLLIENSIVSNGVRSYSLFGTRVFVNLFNGIVVLGSTMDVLSRLASTTGVKDFLVPVHYLWLALLALVFGVFAFRRNSRRFLVFLAIQFALGLVVVLGFPVELFTLRYTYLAAIATSILFAMLFETMYKAARRWVWLKSLVPAFIGIIAFLNGQGVAESSAAYDYLARQIRIPFREVRQRHPSFESDTYLFFVEPPTSIAELSGMFFTRYGDKVIVGGTHEDGAGSGGGAGVMHTQFARLRDHKLTYVYYFDENGHPVEIVVDPATLTHSSPESPVDFAVPIRLEGYEITSSTIKPGGTIVALLYWRATGRIDKDYTVFVHLVDANGQRMIGEDSMPRSGKERTSAWRINQLTADAHVIILPQDAPLGKHRLEIGLYYLPTLERVAIADPHGLDRVVIQPLSIE